MQIETDIKMLKSMISVLENCCEELTNKYSNSYVRCYYESWDYKRIIKVTDVTISDGTLVVHGKDQYGVVYYYYSHAHFEMVDGWFLEE